MELTNLFKDNWGIKEVWRDGKEFQVVHKDFLNYFYVKPEDIDLVIAQASLLNTKIDVDYKQRTTIDGKKVIKVYCKFYFFKLTQLLKEQGVELYESDLSEYVKYCADNKINFSSNRRIWYLDIENDMCVTPFNPEKEITCIGLYDNLLEKYFIFTFNKDYNSNFDLYPNCEIVVCMNEKDMLESWIEFFVKNRPDILAGWYSNDFDLPYIINRCRFLNIDINRISLSEEACKIKCEQGKDNVYLKIPGVYALDLIPILKRITAYMYQPSNYRLDTVAKFFIDDNIGKNIFDLNKYSSKSGEKFKEFLDYNFKDIELLKMLDEKMGILNYCITLQKEVVPVMLENITFNTYLLEMFLKLKYPEIILLDKPSKFRIGEDLINLKNENQKVRIKGAFTGKYVETNGKIDFISPVPGVYKNVEVFDFSGMYASIYSTFNISQDTLVEDGDLVIDNIEADIYSYSLTGEYVKSKEIILESKFNTKVRGLIPQIIDDVRSTRAKYKKQLKEISKEDKVSYQKIKALEDVYKLLGNAFYGVFSFNNFRLYNPYINGAITKIARDCITCACQSLIRHGYEVLYGDTDSVFFYKNGEVIDKEKANELVNKDLKDFVLSKNSNLEKYYCMSLGMDKSFKILVMKEAKKKYFGLLEDNTFVAKGFDIIRQDTPTKIKPILKQLFLDLLEKDKHQIKNNLIEIKKYIKSLDYQDLGINLNISKSLEEYKVMAQHIRAAEYSNLNLGTHFNKGDKVKLLFISSTGKYPQTDVLCVDDTTILPEDFKIDYERTYEFLIIKKLKLLSEIPEFDINFLTSQDKSLGEYF